MVQVQSALSAKQRAKLHMCKCKLALDLKCFLDSNLHSPKRRIALHSVQICSSSHDRVSSHPNTQTPLILHKESPSRGGCCKINPS
eukprot:4929515-Amphidinium_carterae.3